MGPCLTLGEFEQHASGGMGEEARARFEGHLSSCQSCTTSYQSFLADNRRLAGIRKTLDPSPLDQTHTTWRSAAQVSPGEHLPDIEGYQIKRIVGRGGMAVVYEAVQLKLNRTVALKLLPAIVSSAQPELVTRFRREAAAAAKLHHTNIIPIYDFGESRDGYYYAMELLDGLPLNTMIQRLSAMDAPAASHAALAALLHETDAQGDERPHASTFDAPSSSATSVTGTRGRPYYRQVSHWIVEAAEALHYAHLQGMIHRDVKPSNLMLRRDGRVVVLDFGLVKMTADQSVTTTGSLLGTWRYMSPEQVGAKRVPVDARSDVYSLGAAFYELLTFQPTFASTEQSELLSQILFREPTPPKKVAPTVPTDLQTICLKALEKSPSARYQSARAMAEDLRRYLQDLAIVARPQGPITRALKFVRRHRVGTIAVVAALLLTVASTLGLWAHRQRQQAVRQRQQAVRLNLLQRQQAVRLNLLKGAVVEWEKHDWETAEGLFNQVLDRHPRDYATLVNLAAMYKDQYYAVGNATLLDKAHLLLDRATKADPTRHEAWNARGALHRARNRSAEAVDAYQQVLKLDDTYFAAWINLGMVHATDGNLIEAERCLRKGAQLAEAAEQVVETDAQKVMPWRVLAAVQLQSGHGDAVDTLDKALELSRRTDIPTLVLASRHHLAQGSDADLEQAYRFAMTADELIKGRDSEGAGAGQRNQNLIRVKRILALATLHEGQWRRAIRAADEAIAAGSQAALPRLVQAVAWGQLGERDAARRHLGEAEAAWPEELQNADFVVADDGDSLWFDTAAELHLLESEAHQLLEAPAERP